MWLFLDFVIPELNTSTAEVLFGMALTEPCLARGNWSLQWPKAEGDQNLEDVVFAARHRSWFQPSKNSPEVEGIDQDISGGGVWIPPGAVSHHSRGEIAASSQKMQREVESTALEKAQIGPVFRKGAETEMSPLWSVQPRGTRNVCGFGWRGAVLPLGAGLGDLLWGPLRNPWTHGMDFFVKWNQQVLWGGTAPSSEDLQARVLCLHLGGSGSNWHRHVRVNFLSIWSGEYLEACEMEQERDGVVGDC